MSPITESKRYELVAQRVTLDGLPASVCGVKLDFPRVVQTVSGLSVEFAWPTVQHIIEKKNGSFGHDPKI